MIAHFISDDDPTEILQFRFLDENGKLTKASFKSAFKPPFPLKYWVNLTLTVICTTVLLLWNYGVIRGNRIGFFCNDPTFSHKYMGDTITPVMLGFGLALIMPIVYFSIENIRQQNFKDAFSVLCLMEYYLYLKQFVIGIIIVGAVTEIAKTIVGEHRPHFFDTCMPDTNINCTNGTYIHEFTCTNPNIDTLKEVDASRSFPSGHSSLSWFAAIFCAYIVHTRLSVQKTGTAMKLLLLGICISFGLTCSLTRITDRRHHWWDVLTGTVIAIIGAAYVIRITDRQVKFFHRNTDPEESTETEQVNYGV